jgi:methionyl-tRNA synthetase
VLFAGDCPTGTKFLPEEEEPAIAPAEVDIDTFFSYPIVVKDYTVLSGDKKLLLNGNPVRTSLISDGEVN